VVPLLKVIASLSAAFFAGGGLWRVDSVHLACDDARQQPAAGRKDAPPTLDEAIALLRHWGRLHWVRNILSTLGLAVMLAHGLD
jgi:hypothetical protein